MCRQEPTTNLRRSPNPGAERFNDRYHLFTPSGISYNSNTYSIDEGNDGITDYSFSDPDFNFRQFRSNMVIRWEYTPGSTLYLVWSQGRTSSVSDGTFSYRNDIKDLFDVKAHNVFLLKFSYWFSL